MKFEVGCAPVVLVFIVFLILKLTGAIGWSWWWVTAPIWIPAGIAAITGLFWIAFIVVVFLGALTYGLLTAK